MFFTLTDSKLFMKKCSRCKLQIQRNAWKLSSKFDFDIYIFASYFTLISSICFQDFAPTTHLLRTLFDLFSSNFLPLHKQIFNELEFDAYSFTIYKQISLILERVWLILAPFYSFSAYLYHFYISFDIFQGLFFVSFVWFPSKIKKFTQSSSLFFQISSSPNIWKKEA